MWLTHYIQQSYFYRLGYKILTSYVWAHLYCPAAGYVAKTDDNLELRVGGGGGAGGVIGGVIGGDCVGAGGEGGGAAKGKSGG